MPSGTTLGLTALAIAAVSLAKTTLKKPKPVAQSHVRGRSLRSGQEAAEILARARKAGDPSLSIGRQLFPSDIATRHIAFVGTTGSGKTLLQRLLLQSALEAIGQGRGVRALVYDAKQDALSILKGIRPDCEIHVLNPLDERAVAWNMAHDIDSPTSALQLATALVPDSKNDSNPFFTNAARQLVYGALLALLQRAPGRWSFRQALLLLRDPERLQKLLALTPNTQHLQHYFSHPGTAQNIFSTVLSHTTPFEIIAACWDRASHSLSLNSWFNSESILLLGNSEANRAALTTLNQLIFQRIAELTLEQAEILGSTERRTWFFLDEVREAGHLEALSRLLTTGRSKGAAVVIGFQDTSGLREAYGREIADEILGQCNTKVILRLNSPESAEWAAKLFGTREILETRFGKSKSRRFALRAEATVADSLSHGIVQSPLVLDSEILGLPETSREHGVSALILNPMTGPFEDHVTPDWLSKHLMRPDPEIRNFIRRPNEQQYLRPWSSEDEMLFQSAQQEAAPGLLRFELPPPSEAEWQ